MSFLLPIILKIQVISGIYKTLFKREREKEGNERMERDRKTTLNFNNNTDNFYISLDYFLRHMRQDSV